MYLRKGAHWAIAPHWRRLVQLHVPWEGFTLGYSPPLEEAVQLHVPWEGFTLGYSPPLEEGCLVTCTLGRVYTGVQPSTGGGLSSYMYLTKGSHWAIALHWRRAVQLHVPGEGFTLGHSPPLEEAVQLRVPWEGFTLGYSPPLEEGCLVTCTLGRVYTGVQPSTGGGLSCYMYLGKGLHWAIALLWRRAVQLHVSGEGFTLGYLT